MRLATAALIVLVACSGGQRGSPEVAQPLPPLTLPLITGGTWSSTSTHGVLVIDVWASWCKPCSKAFPKLDALAARDASIAIIAISIDEDPAAIRAFLAQFPLAVPVAQDAKQTLTGAPLRISHLPTVLIVDGTGVIRRRLEEATERDYDKLGELVGEVRAR